MTCKKMNPVALVGADRARNSSDCLAALDGFENILNPSEIQDRRANWIARRFAIPAGMAVAIAFLAFGEARQ